MKITEGIALISSVVSIILAYLALHYTVLKKSTVEIKAYINKDEVRFNSSGGYKNISTSFMIDFPVVIANTGPQPIGVREIRCKFELPKDLDCDIFGPLRNIVGINDYIIFTPYEQKAGTLQVKIKIKGDGEGFTDDYICRCENIKELIKSSKTKLIISYKVYERKRIKEHNKTLDVTDTISFGLLHKDKIN